MAEPAHPASVYFRVYLALMAMAALTTGIAFINLGFFAAPAALIVATAKTVLVVLYFMHVRFSSPVTKLFAGAGFFCLLILVVLTLGDVVTRGWMQPR
jgi:cytochrome c oxidase subunit 4